MVFSKVFDLGQIIYDHQQAGQPGKNDDASKEACLNFSQQCFNFKKPKKIKLSWIGRREDIFYFFHIEQKYLYFLLAFVLYTFIFNFKNTDRKICMT